MIAAYVWEIKPEEMVALTVCASRLIGCSVFVCECDFALMTGAGTFVPSLKLSVEVCYSTTSSPVETHSPTNTQRSDRPGYFRLVSIHTVQGCQGTVVC